MRRLIVLTALLWLSFTGARAQDAETYPEVFEWVVNYFAANDAGYPGVVVAKGEEALAAHTEACREFIAGLDDDEDFAAAVRQWLRFFRRGHHYFGVIPDDDDADGGGYFPEVEEQYKPSFKMLSDETALLTINSFSLEYKPFIDEVLADNDTVIRRTPNLIIDIRRSRGGSDHSFYGILPYIYTNPVMSFPMEVLSTPDNIRAEKEMLEWVEKTVDDAELVEDMMSRLRVMEENTGGFAGLDDDEYPDFEVLPYPRKVGLIFRINNGSTDEEFILAAKQSTKVKTFGVPTLGSIDVSNVRMVDSPGGRFMLNYCISRSSRMDVMKVDDTGIQPDFVFPKSIHNREWLDHVQRIFEYK